MQNAPLQISSKVVACRDGLVEAQVDGEVLALSIEKGTCYGLNKVASRIWTLLAEPKRVSEVCTTLLGAYKVDPDVCERQVLDLLEDLRAQGMITALEEK